MRNWTREGLWLLVLVMILVTAGLFAYFELPNLVVRPNDLAAAVPTPVGTNLDPPAAATAVDLVNARNGARTAAVTLLAAIGAAFATAFAGRTYYLTRAGKLEERYSKAAELLEKKDEAVRVHAIRDLERLAVESRSYRIRMLDQLASVLRDAAREDSAPPPSVRAACDAIGRRRRRRDRRRPLILTGADLREVDFDHADLSNAQLDDADLRGAWLRHASLRSANLLNAKADDALFDGADLTDARLDGAGLSEASLDTARLRGATFEEATLRGTSMLGADLRGSRGLRVVDRTIPKVKTDEATKFPQDSVGLVARVLRR